MGTTSSGQFRRKGWPGGGGFGLSRCWPSLEEDGLIAGRDEGERRTYEVTEKGRERLDEHVARLRRLLRRRRRAMRTRGRRTRRPARGCGQVDASGRDNSGRVRRPRRSRRRATCSTKRDERSTRCSHEE